MHKAKDLFNLKAYKWLIKQARPHWKSLLLITFLKIVLAISTVASAILSKQVIDLAISHHLQQALVYALLFALLLLMQIAFTSFLSLKVVQVRERMNYQLQSEFVNRLFNVEWLTINKYHSGDILTRLTSDVSTIVDGWTLLLPSILSLIVQLFTAFFTLLHYDKTLALFAFLLGPLAVLMSFYLGRKYKTMQHEIQAAESQYRSFLHETVQNILVVKTFEYENESLKRISTYQQIKYGWVMKRTRLGISANLVLSFGYRLGYFLAFGWGAFRISTGSASFGTFTAFLQLVGQIQHPFEGLSSSLPQVISTIASTERLMEFESSAIETRNSSIQLCIDEVAGLSMNHVSFAYEKNKPILIDVSFQVKPGEMVALIGPSGEGKTTIIRMLLALILPASGTLYLNGKDCVRIPVSASTRPFFSYVPQGNTLFSGTIADNLRIGCPLASINELIDALIVSCSWQFVQELPNGIDTVIGERGLGLSEGQAQRLSIARSLLKKSSILLLDEATSSLDITTECAVLSNIRNSHPLRTCIVITHRSTVSDFCDYSYQLVNGILYEQKTTSHSKSS